MKVMEFCHKHEISMSFRKSLEGSSYIFTFKKDDKTVSIPVSFSAFLSDNENVDEMLIEKVKEHFEIKEGE